MYDFQYVNHNFLILYPDKEESVILHRYNIMKYLRYSHEMDESFKVDLNPLLLPFIHAVLGDKKRSLPKIRGIGFKKLYKSLEKLYEADFLDDENVLGFNIEHLGELIKESKFFNDTGVKETIMSNYFAINLDRQLNIVEPYMRVSVLDAAINKFDNNGLKRLNDKVFFDYPLHLVELNNYNKKLMKDASELWMNSESP